MRVHCFVYWTLTLSPIKHDVALFAQQNHLIWNWHDGSVAFLLYSSALALLVQPQYLDVRSIKGITIEAP